MDLQKPRIIITQNNDYANIILAGILWLIGCDVYKATTADDCLNKVKRLQGKVDVVVISGKIALDRSAMLIINVRRTNSDTKILVIADEDNDKTRILYYGADEFTLKPMSAENVVDKVFMLLARQTIADNR